MFKLIEGEFAIVVASGVYQQVDLYERNGRLYARYGRGYVQLYANGGTSKDKLKLDTVSYSESLYVDAFGKLYVTNAGHVRLIGDEVQTRLLAVV